MKKNFKIILIREDGVKHVLNVESTKPLTNGHEGHEFASEMFPELIDVVYCHDGIETLFKNGLESILIYEY